MPRRTVSPSSSRRTPRALGAVALRLALGVALHGCGESTPLALSHATTGNAPVTSGARPGGATAWETTPTRNALETLLAQGRRVALAPTRDGAPAALALASSSLGLASDDAPVAAAVAVDLASGRPVAVALDTTTSSDVAEADLVARGRDAVAATFASALAAAPEATTGLTLSAPRRRDVGEGLIAISFTAALGDVPVRDAYAEALFTRFGAAGAAAPVYRLRELRSRHLAPLARDLVAPALPSDAAILAAVRDLAPERVLSLGRVTPQILVRDGATDAGADASSPVVSFAVACELVDETTAEPLVVTLDVATLAPLEAFSRRLSLLPAARANAMAYPRNYRDAVAPLPLSFAQVAPTGGAALSTDAIGGLATAVTGAATVTLSGQRGKVPSGTALEALPTTFAAAAAGGVPTATLAPAALDLRAFNAFLAVQRVNQFARRHYAPGEVSYLDAPVQINIDVTGSCNAFYNASTVNFFAEGGGCAATSLVADVIYHEWGHGLDDFTGRVPGITDGAFSEGIGDIVSSFLVDDNAMGKTFFLANDDPVRNMINTAVYPGSKGEVHAEGQIIGGAFWDMRAALIKRYGAVKGAYMAEHLFFRHLQLADSYLESLDAVLTLDDDDANPATPAPDACLIKAAFAAHGLGTTIADCVDAPRPQAAPTDATLGLGLRDTSAGARLMAATSVAGSTLVACNGELAACLATPPPTTVKLAPEGLAGTQHIFTAPEGSVPAAMLAPGATITLLREDASGKLLGKRTFKIGSH